MSILFRNFDAASFLRDYWQRKPLLIRNPWAGWENPLEPDELAGLACEDEVESRIVTQKDGGWALEHGPFDEARFASSDGDPWTLLVQAVDHYVPDVAALMEPFRFIPNWRMDDVMTSYATDKGGVGPHYDQYDVFLIQGLGRRLWQIGGLCDAQSPLLPHDDLRLLSGFEATEQWVLEPGDILYLPPCIAHNGIAVGDDCMTYSVGFRAPSRAELVEGWCEHLADKMTEEDRYADASLPQQDNPGEITPASLTRLHRMVTDAMQDRDAFARWFGQYSSAPKYPDAGWEPEESVSADDVRGLIADDVSLCRNPASRFSFIRQEDGAVLLFADGKAFPCSGNAAGLAEHICGKGGFLVDAASCAGEETADLIAALVNQGSLFFEEEA